jgi:phenylacetate-CoA ligase
VADVSCRFATSQSAGSSEAQGLAVDELTQKFFETLLKTQFLGPDAMRAYQRILLERLLRHARANVPYYRERGGLEVVFGRDDEIVWDRWHDLPIMTREQAQANAQSLFADVVPPDCGPVTSGQTSGSTGRPLSFRVNGILAAAGGAILERGLVWAGMPPVRRLAWLRYDYDGSAAYPHGALYRSEIRGAPRELHTLSVATDIEDQARWLERIGPDVVMGYPNALALVGHKLSACRTDRTFRLVVCVGEAADEDVRAWIEQAFGCQTMDLYSGSEFGPMAVEDRRCRRLFLSEEIASIEFAFRADEAPRDRLAELIVTPFYNYAMPLIRYAPGDVAIVDREASPDQRTLRRLVRVVGRERSVFILPSGQRWWPTYVASQIRKYLDFEQIQFVQTHRDRIEVRYVSAGAEPVRDADELLAYLGAATPEPARFALARVAEIPRRASGKFEDTVCEIGADRPIEADRYAGKTQTPPKNTSPGGHVGVVGPFGTDV